MGMLSLTFRGPFLFVVPPPLPGGGRSTTVNIYAPKCDGHLGSVFYGDAAVPLFGSLRMGGNEVYTLTGVNPPSSGVISYQWNFDDLGNASPILSPNDPATPGTPGNNFDDAYFCVTVPTPKIFYALNTVDDTGVVTDAGEPAKPFRSIHTAFRLFYDWDLSAIHLAQPTTVNKSAPILDITPPAGLSTAAPAGWISLPVVSDIEFQYEGPELSDADHQDASQCFDSIAKLAGLNSWFLRFQNNGSIGGGMFRHGSDCLAIPIVIK